MDEQIQRQLGIIGEWKKLADVLGSKPLSDLLDSYGAALRQIDANRKREAAALEREKVLKESNTALEKANAELAKRVESMREHPDVKAAERARIAAQINELQRRHESLKPE